MGSDVLQFRKIGGGSLRFNGKLIKPNQIFEAKKEDIPVSLRDIVIPIGRTWSELEGTDDNKGDVVKKLPEEEKKEIEQAVTKYLVVPHGNSNSWFDVVNAQTGKPINEKALRKEVAEQLKHDLET